MAGVVVELTGDEAKLLASMQKIIAQNAKTGESFKKTGDDAKKAADAAVKEQERIERENKKAADSIYAAHKKMLDDHARDSRQYALEEEAIARKIAFVEVQEAVKAAEKEIDAIERILNEKKKAAQKEAELAQKSKDEISDQIAGFAAVTSVVGGYEAAIQLATKAFQLLSDAKSKALQSQETLSDPCIERSARSFGSEHGCRQGSRIVRGQNQFDGIGIAWFASCEGLEFELRTDGKFTPNSGGRWSTCRC